jgi:hypothetical protein
MMPPPRWRRLIKVKQCRRMNLPAAVAGLPVAKSVKSGCTQNNIKTLAGAGPQCFFGG